MESRVQGSRPRPRTQKKSKAKDRKARGQELETGASVLRKKRSLKFFSDDLQKKKVFKVFFSGHLQLRKTKKVFANIPRFLAFSNKISTIQKNSAVLKPRTGQFSRTRGFEAKAKDLTFETKDFKMCCRGRP